MDLFFNALKGQFNTLNFILLLCVLSYFFRKKDKLKVSIALAIAAFVFFILASTAYLPGYIVGRIEARYPPFDVRNYSFENDTVFIHVLGGGYTFDDRLSSQAKLSQVSLGRLAEGLRISGLIPASILVLSGNIASGDSSMASVARSAAIELGFDSARIQLLETPSTTLEEAKAFVDLHGSESNVIVVTDAVHMPRAMRFYNAYSPKAYPAPTNYLIKHDGNPFAMRWMPSVENFLLTDRLIRELLGSIKSILIN